jgi:hypothetical protein
MSGGTFGYRQKIVAQLAEDIDAELEKDYAKEYSPKTTHTIKEVANCVQLIADLVHAVDYLIAGDFSEKTFDKAIKRLFKRHLARGGSK